MVRGDPGIHRFFPLQVFDLEKKEERHKRLRPDKQIEEQGLPFRQGQGDSHLPAFINNEVDGGPQLLHHLYPLDPGDSHRYRLYPDRIKTLFFSHAPLQSQLVQ